jgi:hypothetical protein
MKVLSTKVTDDIYDQFSQHCQQYGTVKNRLLYLLVLNYLQEDNQLKKELRKISQDCQRKNQYYKKIYGQLGKIGSNINQIARVLNTKRIPSKHKKELLNLVIETVELIQDLKQRLQNGDIQESQTGNR